MASKVRPDRAALRAGLDDAGYRVHATGRVYDQVEAGLCHKVVASLSVDEIS